MAQAALEAESALDPETMAPMMLALLKDRFGLKYHTEQREVQAYDLVRGEAEDEEGGPGGAVLVQGSPQQVPGAAPAPQGSQALICQNITMAQFAELLRGTNAGPADTDVGPDGTGRRLGFPADIQSDYRDGGIGSGPGRRGGPSWATDGRRSNGRS